MGLSARSTANENASFSFAVQVALPIGTIIVRYFERWYSRYFVSTAVYLPPASTLDY